MLTAVLNWLSGGIVGQIGKQLNQAYAARLQAQTSKEKVEADKRIAKLKALKEMAVADAQFRRTKLSYGLLRLPLFLAEFSASLYILAVFFDSAFPSSWLNPLELPGWFQPHFGTIMVGLFGIGAASRLWRR